MDHPIPAMVFEAKLQSYSSGCMGAQEMPAVCESDGGYIPRRPQKSVLYEAVAGYLETFLAQKMQSKM
jgi:hypothetical protein